MSSCSSEAKYSPLIPDYLTEIGCCRVERARGAGAVLGAGHLMVWTRRLAAPPPHPPVA